MAKEPTIIITNAIPVGTWKKLEKNLKVINCVYTICIICLAIQKMKSVNAYRLFPGIMVSTLRQVAVLYPGLL